MTEYDRANFTGVYEGQSLVESVSITEIPWEIGQPQPVVGAVLKDLRPGRLLDVGCGLGRNAKLASDYGHDVVAIDISATAINKCLDLYSNSGIQFYNLDACNTGLARKFDVILDSATYHAIPKHKRIKYLREMSRLAFEETTLHLITFAASDHGMPKPLASELSEIAETVESGGWQIELAERVEYKGNAAAIEEFRKKKGLNIRLDGNGRTRLPAWHLSLRLSQS